MKRFFRHYISDTKLEFGKPVVKETVDRRLHQFKSFKKMMADAPGKYRLRYDECGRFILEMRIVKFLSQTWAPVGWSDVWYPIIQN
jgi:hypothetical protein